MDTDLKTLRDLYSKLDRDPPESIPFAVWLMENPDSPLPFPGQVSLRHHDLLHLILDLDYSPESEAYLVGWCIGNQRANWFHLAVFRFVASRFYPGKFRCGEKCLEQFDRGVLEGRMMPYFDWAYLDSVMSQTPQQIRQNFKTWMRPYL
jgi:hypothetical protein